MEWLLSCDYGSIRHRNRWFLSKYFFFMLSFLAGIKGNVEFSSLQWWGWKGHIGCGGGTLIKVRLRDQVGDELDPWNGFGRGLKADLLPPCCHGHLPPSLSAPRPAQTGLGHFQGWGWCGIDWSKTEHGDAAVAGGQCSEAAGRVSLRWAPTAPCCVGSQVWNRCSSCRDGEGRAWEAPACLSSLNRGGIRPQMSRNSARVPCGAEAAALPWAPVSIRGLHPAFFIRADVELSTSGSPQMTDKLIPYPLQFLPCFFRSHVCFVSFFVGLVFFLDIFELYIKFSSVHA